MLFDFWKGTESEQLAVWEAISFLQNAFTKKAKASASQDFFELPAGAESYWLAPSDLTPGLSADHAPGRIAPTVNWFEGPLYPPKNIPGLSEVFAPDWFKVRLAQGTLGAFDLEKMCRDAGFRSLSEIFDERAFEREVQAWFPALKYVCFDPAILKSEQWQATVNDETVQRMAHTCLRIEAVCAKPTDEKYTKLKNRVGVAVVVRCTCCGDGAQIWSELSAKDLRTHTGF